MLGTSTGIEVTVSKQAMPRVDASFRIRYDGDERNGQAGFSTTLSISMGELKECDLPGVGVLVNLLMECLGASSLG